MRVRFLLASLVVLVAVAMPVAQAPVDLSGNWRLNAQASDVGGTGGDESEMPTAGRVPVGGLGMPGRQPLGGYGSPGGPASPGAAVDPQTRKQRMELLRELLEPVRKLSIAQDSSAVSFTYDDGRTVRYRTNGKAERHQAVNGVVETETRWKKNRLVRETSLDDGVTIEETFTLTSPRGLSVEIEIGGGVGRRKPIKRIYDPVE
jgi:ribosomal protein L19